MVKVILLETLSVLLKLDGEADRSAVVTSVTALTEQ